MNNLIEVERAITKRVFRLPENLNLQCLIDEFGFPKFKRGKFNYLSAKILLDDLFKLCDKNQESQNYGYATMHSKRMDSKVYNSIEYIEWFGAVGIILDSTTYRRGKYSKSYKLNALYFKSRFVTIVATELEIKKKLSKLAEKQLPKSFIRNNLHLFRGFNEKLGIDSSLNESVIEAECTDSDGVLDDRAVRLVKFPITSIRNHNFSRISIDRFGGRFYTPITTLKKNFRNFIRYDNEILVELDIKNSLPFFLNVLMQIYTENVEDTLWGEEMEWKRSIMFGNSNQKIVQLDHNDRCQYLKLTSNGQIYESLRAYFKETYGEHYISNLKRYNTQKGVTEYYTEIYHISKFNSVKDQERAICKKLFVKHLFGKISDNPEVDGFYTKNFPSVLQFIDSIKSDKNLGYKQIAKKLQSLEAKFILEIITKEFCEENQDAVVFTIHDCIATQIRFANKLKEKANEVFLRHSGACPSFHEAVWCLDQEVVPEAA